MTDLAAACERAAELALEQPYPLWESLGRRSLEDFWRIRHAWDELYGRPAIGDREHYSWALLFLARYLEDAAREA